MLRLSYDVIAYVCPPLLSSRECKTWGLFFRSEFAVLPSFRDVRDLFARPRTARESLNGRSRCGRPLSPVCAFRFREAARRRRWRASAAAAAASPAYCVFEDKTMEICQIAGRSCSKRSIRASDLSVGQRSRHERSLSLRRRQSNKCVNWAGRIPISEGRTPAGKKKQSFFSRVHFAFTVVMTARELQPLT